MIFIFLRMWCYPLSSRPWSLPVLCWPTRLSCFLHIHSAHLWSFWPETSSSVYKTRHHTQQPLTTKTHPDLWPKVSTALSVTKAVILYIFEVWIIVFPQRHFLSVLLFCKVWLKVRHPSADNRNQGMNSGNNLGNWLVSSPARGTYNSITCSLTANDIVPPICGSLEQNRVHGWLLLVLPRGFLPPLMTSKTSTLQIFPS